RALDLAEARVRATEPVGHPGGVVGGERRLLRALRVMLEQLDDALVLAAAERDLREPEVSGLLLAVAGRGREDVLVGDGSRVQVAEAHRRLRVREPDGQLALVASRGEVVRGGTDAAGEL